MQRVHLFINGTEVNLPEGENLLLFTYQFADLQEPAAVLNSYSRELTLPPTATNNLVFSQLWRPDLITPAQGFDPLARTPFDIRDEAGRLLESGYCKLESASATEGFTITLYGGLGSFFYGLTYGEDGEKKTLADLDYGQDLTFTINAATVADFWTKTDPRWNIFNFAPMDNGIPDNFDAKKAWVRLGQAKTSTVTGYSGKGGYTLVTMPQEHTEWEMRDLRSYLQRPVVSMEAVLKAIEEPANNGGYTFDWSDVQGLYSDVWMALPMLTSINEKKKADTIANPQLDNTPEATPAKFDITYNGTGIPADAATTCRVEGQTVLHFTVGAGQKVSLLKPKYFNDKLHPFTVAIHQLIAYNSMNTAVGGSDFYVIAPVQAYGRSDTTLLNALKAQPISPWTNANWVVARTGDLTTGSNKLALPAFPALECTAYNVDHFELRVTLATLVESTLLEFMSWDILPAYIRLWSGRPNGYLQYNPGSIDLASYSVNISYETKGGVRTGTEITQQDLLGGTEAPAAYLVGLAKAFGWLFTYDAETKTVKAVQRDHFFTALKEDIDDRIDRSSPISIRPNLIDAKWLKFAFQDTETDWAEQYREKYGRQYASQLVNTGSEFNRETVDVLDGTPFKQAVAELLYSQRYYYFVTDGAYTVPAAWLDNGLKYTLWASGTAAEFNIPNVTGSAVLDPIPSVTNTELYNRVGSGYDNYVRTQARDASNKEKDITGALLWWESTGSPKEMVNVTDDTPDMLDANGGVPCWIPDYTQVPNVPSLAVAIPHFLPYRFDDQGAGAPIDALDFGVPKELDIPYFFYEEWEKLNLYARRWEAFVVDRYDRDARICTCKVDWSGLKVGQERFAPFYWFDGCLWALNKITDYCYDNPDYTECEFVKVGDPLAYTAGQQ